MGKKYDFEVILGTYEEYLLGYRIKKEENKYSLTQSFATHDHLGSVRTVACAGKFVASGGSDDRIFIYDFKIRREHTVLNHHKGTVNTIAFTPDNTHLLSASEDGCLTAVRLGNWQIEKFWPKAHGGSAVTVVSLHPSGKLALTLGNDGTLRTWNLVKGRQAFVIRLNLTMRRSQIVCWNPNEQTFVLCAGRTLEVWNIEKGGCEISTERKSNITSVQWLNEDLLIVGHENGNLALLNNKLEEVYLNEDHKSRLKCLSSLNSYLVTADSSGIVKLWRFKNDKLKQCCSVSTGCRITCMTLVRNVVQVKDETEKVQTENVEEIIDESDKINQEVVAVESPKKIKKRKKNNNDEEICESKKKKNGLKKKINESRKKNNQNELKEEENESNDLEKDKKIKINKNDKKIKNGVKNKINDSLSKEKKKKNKLKNAN